MTEMWPVCDQGQLGIRRLKLGSLWNNIEQPPASLSPGLQFGEMKRLVWNSGFPTPPLFFKRESLSDNWDPNI